MVSIAHANLNQGRVLYENLARQDGATVNFTVGTESVSFPFANANDWRDFSLFLVPAGETFTIEVTLPDGGSLDSFAGYLASRETGTGSILVEGETSAAVFQTVGSYSITGPEADTFLEEDTSTVIPAGLRLRITIVNLTGDDLYIRQLAFGNQLTFPMGQYTGIAPPTPAAGIIRTNKIAENGSILGSDVRRVTRGTTISLEYLDRDYVRSTWEPFAVHMIRYACFYQWNPISFPGEVVYGAATNIQAPINATPVPTMSVSMPLTVRDE